MIGGDIGFEIQNGGGSQSTVCINREFLVVGRPISVDEGEGEGGIGIGIGGG